MHYHCEIIMPPTDDVEAAVAQVMEPFNEAPLNEQDKEDREERSSYRFWDWWVIGGRWSGQKLLKRLGKERVQAFRDRLSEEKITVSGLRMGKPTLQPATQISLVDEMWREAFPDSGIAVCPLFDHYKGSAGDVCTVAELPVGFTAERVIIARPCSYGENRVRAFWMDQQTIWNGVRHLKTDWDGLVSSAILGSNASITDYAAEYRGRHTVQPDWIAVTVDYHS